ncbi:MAG: hypothetical protein M3Y25_06390, partial [Thermoproteota archaeon]|nr:hypothetical protein [Thermoproteota archaeon]
SIPTINTAIENTPRLHGQKITGDIPKVSSSSPLTVAVQRDTNEPWLHAMLRESKNSLCFSYFKIFRESKKRAYKVAT